MESEDLSLETLALAAFSQRGRGSNSEYFLRRIESESEGTAWSRALNAEAIASALKRAGWRTHPESGDGIFLLYKRIEEKKLKVTKIIENERLTRIVWKTVPISPQ
ncbi:MAG: hypothetical protein QXK42_04775 [Candidatus Korarchaeum sp.]